MITPEKSKEYDLRFHTFLRQVDAVGALTPRAEYLYKIMDGVPFKDLETALLMAQMEHGKASKRRT